MRKVRYEFIKNLRYFCLIGVFALGLMTIVATGGGGGGGAGGGDAKQPEAEGVIGPEGGMVEVTDTSSPLYGVNIEVPAGALEEDIVITITQVYSEPQIPETAVKTSGTVSLGPEDIVFNTPVSITIPYNDSNVSDENTLQIYAYNGSSWGGVTFKNRDTEANTITALSVHFSPHAVLEPKNPQESGVLDTGFTPNVNGFSIKNFGYPGNCAGMVNYAKWIYENNKCDLYYSAYDDKTEEEVAEKANDKTETYISWDEILKNVFLPIYSEKSVADQLISNIKTNDLPILLILEKAPALPAVAHMVLVYAYDYDKGLFYIYDPQYPGTQGEIEFDGWYLEDYNILYDPDYATDYYAVWTSNIYDSEAMQTVFDLFPCCANIAGNWNGTETVTINCCLGGDCDTDTFSGTTTITIQQNGCDISYDIDISGLGTFSRTGTINGNNIQLSGLFAILQPSCSASQNSITISGTVNGDQINLQGSGIVNGTCDGVSFSCTGDSTATLTRLSSSSTINAMEGKEAIREPSTLLLNNYLKIFTIIAH